MESLHVIATIAISIILITILNFAITGNVFLICDPGQKKCNQSQIMECNVIGTAWEPGENCTASCRNAQCMPEEADICIAGEMRCFGKHLQSCADGKQWITLQTCIGSCNENRCIEPPDISFFLVFFVVLLAIFIIIFAVVQSRGNHSAGV